MITVLEQTFDLVGAATLITANAGKKINIVGISISENSDVGGFFRMQFATTATYGTTSNGVWIEARGQWGIPISRDSTKHAYFIGDTDEDFICQAPDARMSGIIWYYET